MIKRSIPNFITLLNLISGTAALVLLILLPTVQTLKYVAYLVYLGAVFDFLDGLVARLLKVHSELGKQLDSLADVVTFGVVPAVAAFILIGDCFYSNQLLSAGNDAGLNSYFDRDLNTNSQGFNAFLSMSNLKIAISCLGLAIAPFSALRLGRFNLQEDTSDFSGLPTPSNALFIVSLPFFFDAITDINYNLFSALYTPYLLVPLILFLTVMLIAPVPLFALKFSSFAWKGNEVRMIFLICAIILFVIFGFAGIPIIVVLYLLLSFLQNLIRK